MLAVFSEYSACPKCAYRRGPETKPLVAYCDGSGQQGRATCDAPDAEPGEHLHRNCPRCNYLWAEALPSQVPPLSSDEVLTLREIIASVLGEKAASR